MSLGSALELLRPWMTTGFIGAILTLLVKLYIDNRKLRLAEKSREQDFQLEVSVDGRSNLQFVIDNLVRDITAQREAHQDCEKRLEKVSESYRAQGKRLDGIERQFIAFQLDVGRAIPPGDRTPVLRDVLRQYEELEAQTRARKNPK